MQPVAGDSGQSAVIGTWGAPAVHSGVILPAFVAESPADIDINVSEKLRLQIINHEAVEMSAMLEENEEPKKKDKTDLLSQLQWSTAWAVYAAVYLRQHPSAVQGLFVHQFQVHRVMAAGGDWATYDRSVRRLVQKRRRGWGAPNADLELQARLSTSSAATASPPPKKKSRDDVPPGYCFNFHRTGNCANSPCTWAHRCFRCSAPTPHPGTLCQRPAKGHKPHGAGHSKPRRDGQ